jgi:hypothetical protein
MKHIQKTGAKAGLWVKCNTTPDKCKNGGTHVKDGDLFAARNYYQEQTGIKISRITEVPDNAVKDFQALPKAQQQEVREREWDYQKMTAEKNGDRNRKAREKKAAIDFGPNGKYRNVLGTLHQLDDEHKYPGKAFANTVFTMFSSFEQDAKKDKAAFLKENGNTLTLKPGHVERLRHTMDALARDEDEREMLLNVANDVVSAGWDIAVANASGRTKMTLSSSQSGRAVQATHILRKMADNPDLNRATTDAYLDGLNVIYEPVVEKQKASKAEKAAEAAAVKSETSKKVDKVSPTVTDGESDGFDSLHVGAAFDRVKNFFSRNK